MICYRNDEKSFSVLGKETVRKRWRQREGEKRERERKGEGDRETERQRQGGSEKDICRE